MSKSPSATQLVLIAYPRTDAQFEEYIHGNYFSGVDSDEFQTVVDQYPSGRFFSFPVTSGSLIRVLEDVTQGSPYGTGTLNALTPQFKRLASIQGDIFQGPRRFLLQNLAGKQNAWSYGATSSHIRFCPISHVPSL